MNCHLTIINVHKEYPFTVLHHFGLIKPINQKLAAVFTCWPNPIQLHKGRLESAFHVHKMAARGQSSPELDSYVGAAAPTKNIIRTEFSLNTHLTYHVLLKKFAMNIQFILIMICNNALKLTCEILLLHAYYPHCIYFK